MRLAAILPFLILSGCISQPQTYAPPVQRQPMLDGNAPRPPKDMLRMSDPETDAYIIQDIPRGSVDPFRWTGKRPTVRMFVDDPGGRTLVVDYSVVNATLKDTGPVKLTFFVNDQPIGTVAEDRQGLKHFEKAVPREMLKASADNVIAIEVDKVWIAKEDGAHLGFLLGAVGLTH